jgi:phage tail tape-measure protein
MAPVAATRSGRGSSSVFRGVLSGVMLVTAVIIGLLAMHTLNLHGTAAAEAPATMSMSARRPSRDGRDARPGRFHERQRHVVRRMHH